MQHILNVFGYKDSLGTILLRTQRVRVDVHSGEQEGAAVYTGNTHFPLFAPATGEATHGHGATPLGLAYSSRDR